MMRFNFPEANQQCELEDNWKFDISIDHVNSQFFEYLFNEGLGKGSFSKDKSEVCLPVGTVLEVSYFDTEKIMFNILKCPDIKLDRRDEFFASFWVYLEETENLNFKEENG